MTETFHGGARMGGKELALLHERFARLAPRVHAEVAVAQAAVGARSVEQIDTADVDPCPGCSTPVRRFSTLRTGPWFCDACIQARCGGARPVVDSAPL